MDNIQRLDGTAQEGSAAKYIITTVGDEQFGICRSRGMIENAMQNTKFCKGERKRVSHIFRAVGRCQSQIISAQRCGRPTVCVAQRNDVFAYRIHVSVT